MNIYIFTFDAFYILSKNDFLQFLQSKNGFRDLDYANFLIEYCRSKKHVYTIYNNTMNYFKIY